MVVRPQHRVEPVDFVAEQLFAQVRRGIDQDALARIVLDHDGHARATVLWLGRIAGTPVAAHPRHPGRGAAAEHQHPHAAALVNRR